MDMGDTDERVTNRQKLRRLQERKARGGAAGFTFDGGPVPPQAGMGVARAHVEPAAPHGDSASKRPSQTLQPTTGKKTYHCPTCQCTLGKWKKAKRHFEDPKCQHPKKLCKQNLCKGAWNGPAAADGAAAASTSKKRPRAADTDTATTTEHVAPGQKQPRAAAWRDREQVRHPSR